MVYKSCIIATTLVLCSIGNAIAAEISNTPELDGEQRSSTIENASVYNKLESLAANIETNPTQTTVNPNEGKLQGNPLVTKVSALKDTESLTLPMDIEQAWSSGIELEPSPKSTMKLHETPLADSTAAPNDLAVVNTNNEFTSPTIPLADSDLTKYLNMGYYSSQNNLLMGDRRIAQASDSTLTAKPERSIAVADGRPADRKNYVGLTVGSILNIPAYGINAKIGIADNVSVRPFIQYAKAPDAILNLDGGNNSISASGFLYGLSFTYDLNVPNSLLAPYVGIGLANASGSYSNNNPGQNSAGSSFTSPVFIELGADYKLTDETVVNANYKFQDLGFLSLGMGYRF
jgi:opacity protein-like surface antigen